MAKSAYHYSCVYDGPRCDFGIRHSLTLSANTVDIRSVFCGADTKLHAGNVAEKHGNSLCCRKACIWVGKKEKVTNYTL